MENYEYVLLTTEQKIETLNQRILGIEELHFRVTMDKLDAEANEDAASREKSEGVLRTLENQLENAKAQLKALGVSEE